MSELNLVDRFFKLIDQLNKNGVEYSDFTIKVVEGHKIRLATAESLYRMKRNTLREIDNLDLRFLKEIMTKRNAD